MMFSLALAKRVQVPVHQIDTSTSNMPHGCMHVCSACTFNSDVFDF